MEIEFIIRIQMDLKKWKEYDDAGNYIHYKDSTGNEEWYEYDDKGNLIF